MRSPGRRSRREPRGRGAAMGAAMGRRWCRRGRAKGATEYYMMSCTSIKAVHTYWLRTSTTSVSPLCTPRVSPNHARQVAPTSRDLSRGLDPPACARHQLELGTAWTTGRAFTRPSRSFSPPARHDALSSIVPHVKTRVRATIRIALPDRRRVTRAGSRQRNEIGAVGRNVSSE